MKQTISTFGQLDTLRAKLARPLESTARIAARGAERFGELARAAWGGNFGVSKVTGKALTLRKTGALEKAATTFLAIGSTIRASIASVKYGKFQLSRGILPSTLPDAWRAELDAIAREEVLSELGRLAT